VDCRITGLTPEITGLTSGITELTPGITGLTSGITGITPGITELTCGVTGFTPGITGITELIYYIYINSFDILFCTVRQALEFMEIGSNLVIVRSKRDQNLRYFTIDSDGIVLSYAGTKSTFGLRAPDQRRSV